MLENVLAEVQAGPTFILNDNTLLILRGGLLLAEGNTESALPLLQRALPLERVRGTGFYFRTARSLARVWEQQGDVAKAPRMLEEASQQKVRTYPDSKGVVDGGSAAAG